MSEKSAAIESLKEMMKGATLLKAGRSGKPHFRQFQLSPDFKSIMWASPNKTDASVKISEISEIVKGQNTKVFQQNPIPEHKNLSFSLVYGTRTLDLVCKDKREYETWMLGIESLRKGFVTQEEIEQLKKDISSDGSDKLQVIIEKGSFKVVVKEESYDVYAWGEGKQGKLGHGEDTDEHSPRVVEALLGREISSIACGANHVIAVSDSGEIYSWGSGGHGRLGNGKERNRFSPLAIAGLRGKYINQVSCGLSHSAAISESGKVLTWGKGDLGQLGYMEYKQLVPMEIDSSLWSNKNATQVCCGIDFTIVLMDDGTLYSFGLNDCGQLGLGDTDSRNIPSLIEYLKDKVIHKITCGPSHVAAVSANGELFMWGSNTKGQIGIGEESVGKNITKPTQVEIREKEISDVACGGYHTIVLTSSGTLYSFGDGSFGQLGVGTIVKYESSPKKVSIDKKITMVACGEYHSSAISENSQVYTWGLSTNGRLGLDISQDKFSPCLIETMSDKQARGIFCGSTFTVALVTHGWVPDKEVKDCMACKKRFTQVRRKHHCRKCGGIFCGDCSSKKFTILDSGFNEPVRVCDKCYSILSKK